MPRRIVLMGVAGCGKSAVGAALAARLGATYLDGDDQHPPANIEKMSRGEPLTDEDRWPWLTLVGQTLASPGGSGSRELIAARMAARSGHFMPASLIDSQFAALEPPAADENAIIVDIDRPVVVVVDGIVVLLSVQ